MPESADLLPGTLDLLILNSVSLGRLHGYGVLLRIGQITGGALQVQQGAPISWPLPPRGPGAERERLERLREGAELKRGIWLHEHRCRIPVVGAGVSSHAGDQPWTYAGIDAHATYRMIAAVDRTGARVLAPTRCSVHKPE